jgi:ABC-type amino acid transport substrate-binding protein
LPDRVGDLRQGRIGTVLGYIYPELSALADRPAVSRDDAPDDETNFRKLLAGRTDYLLTHALFLDHRMRPASLAGNW